MPDIKLCPFLWCTAGGSPALEYQGERRARVVCPCGASGPYGASKEEALERWNDRYEENGKK